MRMTEGVECRKDEDVIDETPAAYKPIDAVMAAQADLVPDLCTAGGILPELELRPNHLGTPLSWDETETWRSSELRKPIPWRSPKWLRTEFSIATRRP